MQLFLQAVFLIANCITKEQYIRADHNGRSESDTDDFVQYKSTEYLSDRQITSINQTFVALIDIVFTDSTKRTCTGTIIHDNVVLTARHCFGKTDDKFVQPEIEASFVVIGSKKMYESGYEQYLPIERIVSHPKYKGWTADIALVYTFAGMASEKPGTILRLAEEKASMPHDSNVTVYSWGQCNDSDIQSDRENKVNDWKKYTKYPLRANVPLFGSDEHLPSKTKKTKQPKTPETYTKASLKAKPEKSKKSKIKRHEERNKKHSTRSRVTQGFYRSRTSSDEYTDKDSLNADYGREARHKLVLSSQKDHGSIFKSWRRTMGPRKKELSVENFNVVNMQTCKEMMKRSLPDKYTIKNPTEYVCYSSEDRFVTDEDAGAPAVSHGHLLAVTVGGVDCDDEHVAVGIKISCFCPWIVQNLPKGDAHLKCCDNCCDDDKSPPLVEEEDDKTKIRIARKKKIRH